ncbi:hypothetical protein MTO96_027603 [Rhipicephalus appendiculatus]
MVVSSVSMVLGIAIERFVCHPLEHPTAPECRPLLTFAHDYLIPPQQKKKQRSSEAEKPAGGYGREPEGNSGKLEDSAIDGVQRHVPEILEAIADGPLGDLDASNVVAPVTRLPAHPPTKSEERWIARHFQLRRLLAVSEETGDDVEDESGGPYAVSSPSTQSAAHVSNRSRRSKRAVALRGDHSVGRRGTHVLRLSDRDGDLTDVEQRDRSIRDGVFFSDDDVNVPAVHREAAESPEAYDDFIDDGGVRVGNETDSFPLPVDVKSYRRRPRGHPHLGDVAVHGRAPALPLWEDADAWTSTTDSSLDVNQEVDRGADNVNAFRRLAKLASNYTSSAGRSIHRKHLHSRRDYWQAPVQDPHDRAGHDKPADEDKEKQVEDGINAALKLLTLDALVGILNRFEDCRSTKHSAFQLVGPDIAIDMASAFVGNSSPWLSVFDEQGATPKFDAVDKMSADLSSLQAKKATTTLAGVIKSRQELQSKQQQPDAKKYVDDAVASLNGITTYMEKQLNDSVWPYLQRNLTAGLDGVKDMLPNIRKMVYSDIGAYFDHARELSKAVDAVCAQGFRRFGEFWFCVWWWYIIGVPCCIAALSLSTLYSKSTPQETGGGGGGDGDA